MARTFAELAHEIPAEVIEDSLRKFGKEGASIALIETYLTSMTIDPEFEAALDERVAAIDAQLNVTQNITNER